MVDQGINPQSARKLTCLCAPTTHPGSFRCRFHRASDNHWLIPHGRPPFLQPSSSASKPAAKPSSRLRNMVPSVEVQKPSAKAAATTTFSHRIGMESKQQRPSNFVSGSQPSRAGGGVFAASNCQSMLRKMHSESPPPIFSL